MNRSHSVPFLPRVKIEQKPTILAGEMQQPPPSSSTHMHHARSTLIFIISFHHHGSCHPCRKQTFQPPQFCLLLCNAPLHCNRNTVSHHLQPTQNRSSSTHCVTTRRNSAPQHCLDLQPPRQHLQRSPSTQIHNLHLICAKCERTSKCGPPSSRHRERRTRCREQRHLFEPPSIAMHDSSTSIGERRQRTTVTVESPSLQQRNATTTFEQIGATANPCHQSYHCCIWNVDDITTAPGTAMLEGEEKEYCCRERRGEEEEKGGSRIWCPN